MYAPAEEYDSDDYDGFSFGDEFDDTRKQTLQNTHKTYAKSTKDILYEYIRDNDWSSVKLMLEDTTVKFDINDCLPSNFSLLIHAALSCDYEMVKYFIEKGADVNLYYDLMSPMIAVCMITEDTPELLNIVQLLWEKNVLINVADRYGITPLMYLSMYGHLDVIKLIIKYASLDARDNDDNTALIHAVEKNQFEVVKLLIENGADIDCANVRGCTAKSIAGSNNFINIFDLFPKQEEYVIPSEYLSYNNYMDLFPTYFQHIPMYVQDLDRFLKGVQCEKLIELFVISHIKLWDFLTITNERLRELGVTLPYQRKRILLGIHKFHVHPWSPLTIKFVKLNDYASFYDHFEIYTSHLKHVIVGDATVVYISQNFIHSQLNIDIMSYIRKLIRDLNDIKKCTTLTVKQIQQLERICTPRPPLLIDDANYKMISESKNRFPKKLFKYAIGIGLCLALHKVIRPLISVIKIK